MIPTWLEQTYPTHGRITQASDLHVIKEDTGEELYVSMDCQELDESGTTIAKIRLWHMHCGLSGYEKYDLQGNCLERKITGPLGN
ncbi:hypothetical protein OLMES_1096 [Oleiphilus messinensis]|uniref:Uncharacterized protein n=1 Tax=Oleiphilus messinensis TaxID=141451 RepID=A0A1Y0I440_9GAMM|nr:hypothetical protein [Oleiphilus messinensis]ARU55181.1 hypothetical protein OLMES_1096 [Oleiphilus messinensis]